VVEFYRPIEPRADQAARIDVNAPLVKRYLDAGLSADSIAALEQSDREQDRMAQVLRERAAANRQQFVAAGRAAEAATAERARTEALSGNQLREELVEALTRHGDAHRHVREAETNGERYATTME